MSEKPDNSSAPGGKDIPPSLDGLTVPASEYDAGLSLSLRDYVIDDAGREILDPTPMAPPVGYKRSIPLRDQIRDMVRSERLAAEAAAAGAESFDEANDFDVDDDFDPRSPWEEFFDPQQADADIYGAAQGTLKPQGSSPAAEPPPAPPEGPKAPGTPSAGSVGPDPAGAPGSVLPSPTQSIP